MAESRATLIISASFVEDHALHQVLQAFDEHDALFHFDHAQSRKSPSMSIEPRRIKPELDRITPMGSEERTEYITVNDYPWPSPPKRQCQRMPDDERRQRHRQAQREFMMRKRIHFQAMRREIKQLENRLKFLQAATELDVLMVENAALQRQVLEMQWGAHHQVWRLP